MSDNTKTEPTVVDVNTDNLDDFSKLMSGEAIEAPLVDAEVKETPDEGKDDKDVEEEDSLAPDSEEVKSESSEEDQEDEDTEAEVTEKPKKSKSRFQERIDQLTHQNKETQRQLDLALGKLNEVADKPKTETQTKAPETPQPDDKSDDGEDKYPLGEFDPLYIRDLTRFTIQQETAAQKAQDLADSQTRQFEEARTALHSEWAVKLSEAKETYPDLSEKNSVLETVFSGIEPAYGEYLASTIMSLEYGVDVLNYLGSNIKEAQQIVASGPAKATIALGRLEARFVEAADTKEVKKPKVSTAPEPPPSVTRGSGTKTSIAPDTDDLDAFEKVFYSKKR